MFRAAVISAIDRMSKDPATMAAIDELAEPFAHGVEGMLEYMWKYPEASNWGSLLGIEYSRRKQAAVAIVTGRQWEEWLQ